MSASLSYKPAHGGYPGNVPQPKPMSTRELYARAKAIDWVIKTVAAGESPDVAVAFASGFYSLTVEQVQADYDFWTRG